MRVRGGAARWKRVQQSHGVKQAVNYAFSGVCDATLTAKTADGVLAAAGYADAVMTRYVVENGAIRDDLLTRDQLKDWVDGLDPLTVARVVPDDKRSVLVLTLAYTGIRWGEAVALTVDDIDSTVAVWPSTRPRQR